jgi:hypothetical protein
MSLSRGVLESPAHSLQQQQQQQQQQEEEEARFVGAAT